MTNSVLSNNITKMKCAKKSGKHCAICSIQNNDKNKETIELIKEEYEKSEHPWFLGFSGGKDSSALLRLTYCAISSAGSLDKPLTVIYCDTGVEIPIISQMVKHTLKSLTEEARKDNVPMTVHIAEPKINDRYFVKVIGRGYPTPTNKFRWCTDRLRINPVKSILNKSESKECTVLLGVRKDESSARNKTIEKYSNHNEFYLRQSGQTGTHLFCPIIDYTIEDVWRTIHNDLPPRSINGKQVGSLYRDASEDHECPIIKDPNETPCGTGRFGCWTCTVIRKDKAVTSLIKEGYAFLKPLLEFRNWLSIIRDNPKYRCQVRRNGSPGPGPFTLDARKEILSKLVKVQQEVPWVLITSSEISAIKQLWDQDS